MDRIENHRQSFASTVSYATKHITKEQTRNQQILESHGKSMQKKNLLEKLRVEKKKEQVKRSQNHLKLINTYKMEEELAKQEYLKKRKLRQQMEKAVSGESKSMRNMLKKNKIDINKVEKHMNKNGELLRRCVANLERMEGVRYWAKMLNMMAENQNYQEDAALALFSGSTPSRANAPNVHIEIILQYCVEYSASIMTSTLMSNEKKEEERRMLIFALRMLLNAWYPNTSNQLWTHMKNAFEDSSLLSLVAAGAGTANGSGSSSYSLVDPNAASTLTKSSAKSSAKSSTAKDGASISTSSITTVSPVPVSTGHESIADAAIVLYHKGTNDHRVERRHPEQNARVTKCAAMISSHSDIPIDTCETGNYFRCRVFPLVFPLVFPGPFSFFFFFFTLIALMKCSLVTTVSFNSIEHAINRCVAFSAQW